MKSHKVFLWLFVFTTATYASAQNQQIKITVDKVKDDQGSILIALYRSADDFMKERFMSLKLPAKTGQVTGTFHAVPPGEYAIGVFHDANNDMELNKNAFGVPSEGLGFSNNASARFGPPDFKKASFGFSESKDMIISLKY